LATPANRQRGEAKQQRNLRIRPCAEQFIVGGRPAVLLTLQQGYVFLAPAHDHTADAALELPREPSVRHCTQQCFFGLSPRPASGLKHRNAELVSAQVDRPPGTTQPACQVLVRHGSQ